MNFESKTPIGNISAKYFFAVVVLGAVALHFLLEASFRLRGLGILLSSLPGSFALIAFVLGSLLAAGMFLAKKTGSYRASFCVLSPVSLLLFWPAQETPLNPLIPAGIVLGTQAMVFRLLRSNSKLSAEYGGKMSLVFAVTAFFFSFTAIGIAQYSNTDFFNGTDWTIYHQSFWNALHGRGFTNSIAGSNFVCHNTWAYYFLLPFYGLYPHPLTLWILKTFLFSVSAVPFFLICRNILKKDPPCVLIFSFLFFPFLVTQNLNAPHEMGYAPFFILWTYYFYQTRRFLFFIGFLIASLLFKEHMAMLAVAFGLFSCLQKRSLRWVVFPVLLGLLWGIFSFWLIAYYQGIYGVGTQHNWIMANTVTRWNSSAGNWLTKGLHFLAGSNLGQWHMSASSLPLFSALGFIPPLLGASSFLALPEYLLNLLCDRPVVFSAIWHYNITCSLFLLIGSVEGIRKILESSWLKRRKTDPAKALRFALLLQLSVILIHSYLWLDFAMIRGGRVDAQTIAEVSAHIPREASVSAPIRIMALMSDRQTLGFLERKALEDYVVTDASVSDPVMLALISVGYDRIFEKNGISVFRKKPPARTATPLRQK